VIVFKTAFKRQDREDLRRIQVAEDDGGYEKLVATIRQLYALPADAQIFMTYIDEEGDTCILSSQIELLEAIRFCKQSKKALKVNVLIKPTPMLQPSYQTPTGPSISQETPSPLSITSPDRKDQKEQQEDQKDRKSAIPDKSPDKAPPEPAPEKIPIAPLYVEDKKERKEVAWWEKEENPMLARLGGMFPDLQRDTIESIIISKKKDEEAVINALLTLNVSKGAPGEIKKLKEAHFKEIMTKVVDMVSNEDAIKLAKRFGLTIDRVTWEDNARRKNSKFGPCISDVSLLVQNRMLPMIRCPNYEDVTWDIPMDKIPIMVGNELDGRLYQVTLKYYLENFRMFLSKPEEWLGGKQGVLAERDTHVVCSAQACMLPMPKGSVATFNLGLLNYQSKKNYPAVLAIVASAQGTSAQVAECDTFSQTQKLYFNNKGQKASFVGQRLSDNRKQRGVAVEGKMSEDEKAQNMIMLIQVPLKLPIPPYRRRHHHHRPYGYKHAGGWNDDDAGYYEEEDAAEEPYPAAQAFGAGGFGLGLAGIPAVAAHAAYVADDRIAVKERENFEQARRRSLRDVAEKKAGKKEKADVEEAIITVGKDEGPFSECNGLAVERDPRYPVRVTFQYYRSTSTGNIEERHMRGISDQIKVSQKGADFLGSLVVKRPTEPDLRGGGKVIVLG